MSVKAQTLFKMVCDHEGCTAEIESYDGGALVFPTIAEAKADAYDHDWTEDEYGLDFCDQHRDDAYQQPSYPSLHEFENEHGVRESCSCPIGRWHDVEGNILPTGSTAREPQ